MSDPFIDTNVLVYAVDDSDPTRQHIARRVLEEHPHAVISTQVMLEWYNVVTRRLTKPLTPDQAMVGLGHLQRMDVRSTHPGQVVAAARLAADAQLSLWDAMIIEAASRAGCTAVLTEDMAAGRSIAGVRIVDPFS